MWARDAGPSLYRQQALNRCIIGSSHPNIFRHLKQRITERRRARGWETASSPLLHSQHFFSFFFSTPRPLFRHSSPPFPFLFPPFFNHRRCRQAWQAEVYFCASRWNGCRLLFRIHPVSPFSAARRPIVPASSLVVPPVLLQPPSCCWAQRGP